jgi:hypothetical protein
VIETELAAWLEDGELGIGDRVFPLTLPQGATLPAIVYQRVSPRSTSTHDGAGGVVSPRFQFKCWASTYAAACALRVALKALLVGNAHGTISSVHEAGTEMDDRDEVTGGWVALVDLFITHVEEA